jgi:hypothetical protein
MTQHDGAVGHHPDIEATVARAVAAFTPQGVTVDALHAWIDHSHAWSLAGENEEMLQVAVRWSHAVHEASRHGTRGTMRAWFDTHHGQYVDTLQVHADGNAWAPGARVVQLVRATFVVIDGSRRYYRSSDVIAQTPDVLIITAEGAVCAYLSTNQSPQGA